MLFGSSVLLLQPNGYHKYQLQQAVYIFVWGRLQASTIKQRNKWLMMPWQLDLSL